AEDGTSPGANLGSSPNPEMTAATFWETLLAHTLTWGNGYAEIERDQALRPIGLWPILPNRIRPTRDQHGKLVYDAVTTSGKRVTLPARDVFHVPGLGFDGPQSYSRGGMARRSHGCTAA